MSAHHLANNNAEQEFTSWVDLVEKGDGYLSPEQYQAFQKAFKLITKQMENTLSSQSGRHKPYAEFEELEERFLDAAGHSEIEQDAALTAYRVLNYLVGEISERPE